MRTSTPAGQRVVRLGGGAFSARVNPRPVLTMGGLLVAMAALLVVAVGTGDVPIAPGDVLASLAGAGDPGTDFIVRELRLPRAACAVVAGGALGVSGAIFQALTRNPLGSPDVIGFQQGAVTGALLVITVLGGSGAAISGGALAGGILSALAVYVLARRDGVVSSYRLILIGIAVGGLALAVNDMLLSRARIEDAQEATRWLLGSLNARGWEDVRPLALTVLVLAVPTALAGRPLRALELGDAAAAGLGVDVARTRLWLVALAVALVAATTTAVGPIAFVALTAPQIARRIAHSAQPPLLCAAATGAVLVLCADVLGQRLVASTPLPVGVMTGALGGLYLACLLGTQWRAGRR